MNTVTIKDVAKLAGVSIKTVSRVMNDEPNVRPVTSRKVREAIAKLAYEPNPYARYLGSLSKPPKAAGKSAIDMA